MKMKVKCKTSNVFTDKLIYHTKTMQKWLTYGVGKDL